MRQEEGQRPGPLTARGRLWRLHLAGAVNAGAVCTGVGVRAQEELPIVTGAAAPRPPEKTNEDGAAQRAGEPPA